MEPQTPENTTTDVVAKHDVEQQGSTASADATGTTHVGASTSSATDPTTSASDVSEHRTLATVGYILPFLFFLPLLDDKAKNVSYVRFHANQQLILLIIMAAVVFLQNSVFMLFMGIGMLILQVVNLAMLALMIVGAMGAYKGEMKELPYVGHFKLLK